ncbi:meiotic recombination protein REC114 isoform X3 [Eptesicus fuscus]|uniref:meiotic recombination protein REC114 isoform X3 n=1 Tax=Eptesicus fuscus TaxID=29078 RepID=UPI002403AA3A|nr:meiotic recombination protein REC114 isoform X3 [Eptesicus fuscus]
MAEAGGPRAGLWRPGGDAARWPLQRYGRFMPLGAGEPSGPGPEAGRASPPTWKVFDSNEESGYLVLTIVISGHFFISQGQTLLNKSRMFRVQFSGESKQQALEHCSSCVQSLAQYIAVQVPDGDLRDPGLRAGGSGGEGCVPTIPRQLGSHQQPEQQQCAPGGRTSVTQLAQSLLASEELRAVHKQSAWDAAELGSFLRSCLMDQNFPAFVEEVEQELRKLMGLRD